MTEESVPSPPSLKETPSASDDGVRIHPHVFSLGLKRSQTPDIKKGLLRRCKGTGDVKTVKFQIEEYAAHLTNARSSLLTKLEASPASDLASDINRAFQEYLGLVSGLLYTAQEAKSEPNTQGSPAGPAPQQSISLIRDAVRFEWQDSVFSNQGVEASDSAFEVASIILAKAIWGFRRAGFLCRDSRPGISTEDAIKAYKLLLGAAGELNFIKQTWCPILENKTTSADCAYQAVSALLQVALADAQSITTLRAMAKNSQPGLIAGLAQDTATLYREAVGFANNSPFSVPGSKPAKYAEYKAAAFQAYALCFTGLARLKEGEGGQAVRLLEEGKAVAHGALPVAAAYNKAQPSTPAADHAEFDSDLRICLDSAYAKAKKENDHVYYKRPPVEVPPLYPPQRLVKTPDFHLPPAHPSIVELNKIGAFSAAPVAETPQTPAGQAVQTTPPTPAGRAPETLQGPSAGGKPDATAPQEEKPACWRWLLVIIAMPVLAVLTVVGLVIWVILLPIKIICCPIGCLIQIIADVVEYLVKAPFKALLWASGKPYKRKERDVESQ